MGRHQPVYVESMDSVRMPWKEDIDLEPAETGVRKAAEIHCFVEVLTALALGREVAVPQSYALDSHVLHTVARMFVTARDDAGGSGRSAKQERSRRTQCLFRLYLHGHRSFDDAVSAMLRRTADPVNPFLSSLLPELNEPAEHGLDPEETHRHATSLRQLLDDSVPWLGDERRQDLELIGAEFRRFPPQVARPAPGLTGLKDLLQVFVRQPYPSADRDELRREVRDDLRRAIQLLDPASGSGASGSRFTQRSRLRLPAPWPDDPRARTPEEIVGGREQLELVTEFVDTLYNAVVAKSFGRYVPAVFSTDAAIGDRRLAARAVAEELALALLGTPPADRSSDDEGQPVPQYEVRSHDGVAGGRATSVLTELEEAVTTNGLRALLTERADERSRFRRNLLTVQRAQAEGRAAEARARLEAHLDHVARLLSSDTVSAAAWVTGSAFQIGLTAAGAAGPTAMGIYCHIPNAFQILAPTVGTVAPALIGALPAVERRRRTRRWAHALGTVVTMEGLGT
jgi:hypothetical protein